MTTFLSSRRFLAAILIALAVGHVGVASIRHPVGPRFGAEVSGVIPGDSLVPGQLRVATYNIRRGRGTDGRRDLARVIDNLEGFDLVGLNEVGGGWFDDQAADIGDSLGMGWLFAPAQRRWYTDYFGNGFLTRLETTAWRSQPIIYDVNKGTGHRNLLYVDMAWRGMPVTVLIAHAERGDIRDAQIEYFFDEFSGHEQAILLGDLNATPDDPIMKRMTDVHLAASATGPGTVDWIFVRGFDVLEAGSIPAGASDHPLLWATLVPEPGAADGP